MMVVTFSVFYYLPETFYRAWKWFAIWYIPLAVLWIAITDSGGGFLAPDREGVLFFTSALYGIVTVSIILITAIIIGVQKIRNGG
jgi:hypothetical protein